MNLFIDKTITGTMQSWNRKFSLLSSSTGETRIQHLHHHVIYSVVLSILLVLHNIICHRFVMSSLYQFKSIF